MKCKGSAYSIHILSGSYAPRRADAVLPTGPQHSANCKVYILELGPEISLVPVAPFDLDCHGRFGQCERFIVAPPPNKTGYCHNHQHDSIHQPFVHLS